MINIINTEIKEVKIIEPIIYNDKRGYFFESYNQNIFNNKIGKINFIQCNESKSNYGVLRGLHYQKKPYEQAKLVRVIKGEIQDIALDIRKESKTYLKYVSVILNEKNKKQLFIPRGFAHGFLVLSKYAIVSYKVDNIYKPNEECVINYSHPKLNIEWAFKSDAILLSKKDQKTTNFDI